MYYLLMNGYKLKPVYFSMEEVLDNYVNIKEINKVEVEKDLIKPYVYHFNMYIDKQSKSNRSLISLKLLLYLINLGNSPI